MIKKALLAIALSISLAALTGCGNKLPDLEDRVADTVFQDDGNGFIGVIEPLVLDIYQGGTHLLKMNDGKTALVQSSAIDLNRYLNQSVMIGGVLEKGIGNARPVFNVTSVQLTDGKLSDLAEYQNQAIGIQFSYPQKWQLVEEAQRISLNDDAGVRLSIESLAKDGNLTETVTPLETGVGTTVTIAAQPSLRFITEDAIRLYVPHPSSNRIYRIIYYEEGASESSKIAFYDVLESFYPLYFKIRSGDKCGGKDQLKCQGGYRCELESNEENAEGICISLASDEHDAVCPYVAPPTGCRQYQAANFNKDSCPTRYECLDDQEDDHDSEITNGVDLKRLTETVMKYKHQLLPIPSADIVQFEVSVEANLVAVVYEENGGHYKTLLRYTPSGNEFNFFQQAHFTREGQEWKLIKGKDAQAGLEKKIIKADAPIEQEEDLDETWANSGSNSGANGDHNTPSNTIMEDSRLYENTFKDFSIRYPKNWYFRSFGAIQDTIWLVGFADKEVDAAEDAIITLKILKQRPAEDAGVYRAIRDRKNDSFFVMEGPLELKEVIEEMADYIE